MAKNLESEAEDAEIPQQIGRTFNGSAGDGCALGALGGTVGGLTIGAYGGILLGSKINDMFDLHNNYAKAAVEVAAAIPSATLGLVVGGLSGVLIGWTAGALIAGTNRYSNK